MDEQKKLSIYHCLVPKIPKYSTIMVVLKAVLILLFAFITVINAGNTPSRDKPKHQPPKRKNTRTDIPCTSDADCEELYCKPGKVQYCYTRLCTCCDETRYHSRKRG